MISMPRMRGMHPFLQKQPVPVANPRLEANMSGPDGPESRPPLNLHALAHGRCCLPRSAPCHSQPGHDLTTVYLIAMGAGSLAASVALSDDVDTKVAEQSVNRNV
ncbi:hypothetical protein H8M03_03810 [Sphingomonas sabuli]|uniref:Uncharacterized protein n=1 Tax=Sphingomonas sabuli TaxID=2764186 RepID=A0A7G9L4C1_9SPHN|nr:hypothetical protein [Sphingomonas sabuli]QNM83470.1 hypothetical protein H8M03_03810 [Sphingomonas sabuli]